MSAWATFGVRFFSGTPKCTTKQLGFSWDFDPWDFGLQVAKLDLSGGYPLAESHPRIATGASGCHWSFKVKTSTTSTPGIGVVGYQFPTTTANHKTKRGRNLGGQNFGRSHITEPQSPASLSNVNLLQIDNR